MNADELTRRIDALTRLYNMVKDDDTLLSEVKKQLTELLKPAK